MTFAERQRLANKGRDRGPELRQLLVSTLDRYRFPRTTTQLLEAAREHFDVDARAIRRALAVLRERGVVTRTLTRGDGPGLTATFTKTRLVVARPA